MCVQWFLRALVSTGITLLSDKIWMVSLQWCCAWGKCDISYFAFDFTEWATGKLSKLVCSSAGSSSPVRPATPSSVNPTPPPPPPRPPSRPKLPPGKPTAGDAVRWHYYCTVGVQSSSAGLNTDPPLSFISFLCELRVARSARRYTRRALLPSPPWHGPKAPPPSPPPTRWVLPPRLLWAKSSPCLCQVCEPWLMQPSLHGCTQHFYFHIKSSFFILWTEPVLLILSVCGCGMDRFSWSHLLIMLQKT